MVYSNFEDIRTTETLLVAFCRSPLWPTRTEYGDGHNTTSYSNEGELRSGTVVDEGAG